MHRNGKINIFPFSRVHKLKLAVAFFDSPLENKLKSGEVLMWSGKEFNSLWL